jgi:hypothetical protein
MAKESLREKKAKKQGSRKDTTGGKKITYGHLEIDPEKRPPKRKK